MGKCRKYCNEIDFFSLRCNCAIEKLLTCAKHAHTHTCTHTHTLCNARNASRDDDVVDDDDDDGDNCVMTAAAYERAWQCRQQQQAHMMHVCVCVCVEHMLLCALSCH